MEIESELKFAVAPRTAGKLLKSTILKQAATGKRRKRRLVSTYFDTRQHTLRKAGAALRVRRGGDSGSCEQTIKLPAPGPAGMQNYEEWNTPVDGPEPELRRFDSAALRRLGEGKFKARLEAVFTTDVERTSIHLVRGNTHFMLDLDIGELCGHGKRERREPVCEAEFELLSGDPLRMLDFLLELDRDIGWHPLYMTKAQRGYALARPALRVKRSKARTVALEPGASVGEAFLCIVGEALGHLQRNLQPALQGQPEGVHQARVAIRRTRAALRGFKSILPYDKRKAFNGEFRWLQSRLAPARDWHVFHSETLPQIAREAPAQSDDLRRLHQLATRERKHATAEAREALAGQRFTRLMLQFQRWLLSLDKASGDIFTQSLQPFALSVLGRAHRDLLLDGRPLSKMTEEERHALRKRGKKSRYAMEFFSSLWQGAAADLYLKQLEQLQDRLGEANDAVVARKLIASLPPRALSSSGLLLVQDWSAAREASCRRAGQPVWRKMQRATCFWH
ncbi:CHAD domain-containing protein [Haliea sp. E17]|uniref:CYTH and CHAD domain-containing protein n=1 Tax=Haliea sp. E17 TaxID=3401576 RepID=UPI003AAFB472